MNLETPRETEKLLSENQTQDVFKSLRYIYIFRMERGDNSMFNSGGSYQKSCLLISLLLNFHDPNTIIELNCFCLGNNGVNYDKFLN